MKIWAQGGVGFRPCGLRAQLAALKLVGGDHVSSKASRRRTVAARILIAAHKPVDSMSVCAVTTAIHYYMNTAIQYTVLYEHCYTVLYNMTTVYSGRTL